MADGGSGGSSIAFCFLINVDFAETYLSPLLPVTSGRFVY